MKIKRMKLDDLIPAHYNPRKDLKPGDPEYEKLKKSMETFGCVEPIVYNERSGCVVGGHQRIKVMHGLGYSEEDTVIVDLDEEEEKTLNMALNKISGEWDMEALNDLAFP